MNEGYLLLAIILATIAVGIYAAFNPVIFGLQGAGAVKRSPSGASKPAARKSLRAADEGGAASVQRRVQRVHRLNPRSAHQKAVNAKSERSAVNVPTVADEPRLLANSVAFITPKELTQLTSAIALSAKGATKQEAVEQAFACTKGNGATWKRGAALFDLATVKGEADATIPTNGGTS